MKLPGKISRRSLLTALIVSAVLCSLLGSRLARPARTVAQFALAPPADPLMYGATAARGKIDSLGAQGLSPEKARALEDANVLLRAHVDRLREQLRAAQEQIPLVQGLHRGLIGPSQDFPCEVIPARVLASGSLPYSRSRTLTPLRDAGVPEGALVTTRRLLTDRSKELPSDLSVISSEALVGRVVAAGPYTAVMRLVTDRDFQMWGRVWRDSQRPREVITGAMREPLTEQNNRPIEPVHCRGDGKGGLIVQEVMAHHNVLPGDRLMTSGDDDALPVDVFVGTVTEVREDLKHPGMVSLYVKPHADVESLRDVYIVLPLADNQTPDKKTGKPF